MCDIFFGKVISALFLYSGVVRCSWLVRGSLGWFGGMVRQLLCAFALPPTSVFVPPFGYLRYFLSDLGAVKSKVDLLNN